VTKWRDRPFALVGVHVGGTDAKQLREVMEREKLGWRSFVDAGSAGAGPIATAWRLASTPTFYAIDARGVIRAKWAGAPGAESLDAGLERLIEAAEKAVQEPSNPGR